MVELDDLEKIRACTLEEFRQELKWADWPISSLIIVENAYEKLMQKKPDNRYKEFME